MFSRMLPDDRTRFLRGTATVFTGISWNERRGAVGVSFYLMEQNISVADDDGKV